MIARIYATVFTLAALALPPAALAGEDAFERDRQAILAMAGEYHITFQFQETVPLRDGYELHEPYRSEATEFVDVVEDAGDRIVLQHILVLEGDDGEPHVVKHWRQDWTYQDTELLEFKGNRTWETRRLSPDEVKGTWSQRVTQVDDSPRYEGYGAWTHEGNLSSWESNETWRPLPRREFSKRDDYQVLVAVNRHTLTPTGWVHEQDNYKLVLGDDEQPILCREVGLNVYDKVDGVDFSPGYAYWNQTGPFWRDVRAAWAQVHASGKPLTLKKEVDGKKLYEHLFSLAKDVRDAGAYNPAEGKAKINQVIESFTVN